MTSPETPELTAGHNLTSLQTFLLSEERKHPHATGSYTMVLSALSLAAKFIAARCRRARLEDVLGGMGAQNVQGEDQQKLDVIANEALVRALGSRKGVAILASEMGCSNKMKCRLLDEISAVRKAVADEPERQARRLAAAKRRVARMKQRAAAEQRQQ